MSNEEKKDMNEQAKEPTENAQKEEAKPAEEIKQDAAPAEAKSAEDPKEAPQKEAKKEEAKTEVAPKAAPSGYQRPSQGRQQRGGGRGGQRRGGFRRKREQNKDEGDGLLEKVVAIKRVAKVVKGGKNFSFSAMVVSGDGKGQVGIGMGKSNEVVEAIKKGSGNAKGSFVKVKLAGDTIPHEVIGRYKASRVLLKPAGPGTGVIAGSTVRAMCDAVGIKDILTKTLGSRNSVNVVKATIDGFQQLRLKRRGQVKPQANEQPQEQTNEQPQEKVEESK